MTRHRVQIGTQLLVCILFGAAATLTRADPFYVDDDAPPGGDGSTWGTAFKYLQDALAAVTTNGTEIRVAQGFYRPDQDEGGYVTPGDRSATFQLINGVALYGGYAGLANPEDPDARDVQAYETTLGGDLLLNDGPYFQNNAENSYHVLTVSGTAESPVLDGFTVSGGNANVSPADSGAGLRNDGASPIVRNCLFAGNTCTSTGGAVFNSSDSPSFQNCVFAYNVAYNGGAMENEGSSPEMTDCVFLGNEAYLGGAVSGITVVHADEVFPHSPAITNCVFIFNYAGNRGGAIFSSGSESHPLVVNCTFRLNYAASYGGAIFVQISEMTLVNSVVWDNYVPGGFPIALRFPPCDLTVSHTALQGGEAFIGADAGCNVEVGPGLLDADPLFADPDGPDHTPGTDDDDLRLLLGSPCIDAGTNAAVPAGITTDADGNPRFGWCHVDLGAYEYQGPFGDFYEDCTVDLDDYALFEVCLRFSGPAEEPPFEECLDVFDFDRDTDVDLADFAGFQQAFTGP